MTAYPCKSCQMSIKNAIHWQRTRPDYHEFVEPPVEEYVPTLEERIKTLEQKLEQQKEWLNKILECRSERDKVLIAVESALAALEGE